MASILISYRRSDSDVFAGRVRDKIADRFGSDSVFMDIDSIPFGRDFRTHIKEALGESHVVIVVIGSKWLGAGKGGRARIQDETDPVRIEIETALQNAIPVLPILAGDARMPKTDQLPETLKDLAFINAATVDTGRDFHPHMDRVLRGLEAILEGRSEAPGGSPSYPAPTHLASPHPASPNPLPVSAPATSPAVAPPLWWRGRPALVALAVLIMGAGAAAWWAMDRMSLRADQPSWCRYAGYDVERTICKDLSFFGKDRLINSLFAQVTAGRPTPAAREALRAEQNEWIAGRNLCKTNDCIHLAYDTRIARLRSELNAGGK